jgi:hypothetical protein
MTPSLEAKAVLVLSVLCLALAVRGQSDAALHLIPARAVRQRLAQQSALVPPIPPDPRARAASAQNCVFTITPLSITVPYTGGSGVITVTAVNGKPTSLILEPLDNGCFSFVVQDADPTALLTVQRSQDLIAWVDAQSFSNSTSYMFTNCFSTNTDHLFLRLVTP